MPVTERDREKEAAGDNGGSAFASRKYTPRGVTVDTWGMAGVMTNAAVAEYCAESNGGALYSVLSHDQIALAHTKAPNGFDFTQLTADFQAIGA